MLEFWISILVLIVPIIFGCFTARRFNFIHGIITTLLWYCLIAGVYSVFLCYTNPEASWMVNTFEVLNKYFALAATYPIAVFNNLMALDVVQSVDFIVEHAILIEVISMFVVPFIVWAISRAISGAIRNGRGY